MSTVLEETLFTINGNHYSHRELNTMYDFFTQTQWDVIDQALDCYAQSQPYEGAEEDTHQVRDTMYELLRAAY